MKNMDTTVLTSILSCAPYRKDRCKKVALGLSCEVGLRRRTYYVLGGSVLSVWSRVEAILNAQPGFMSKMQIIRLRIDDGSKLVGKKIIYEL